MNERLVEATGEVGHVPLGPGGILHRALPRGVSADEAVGALDESPRPGRRIRPDDAPATVRMAERYNRAIHHLQPDGRGPMRHVARVDRRLLGVAHGEDAARWVQVLPDLVAGIQAQQSLVLRPAETDADAPHVGHRADKPNRAALSNRHSTVCALYGLTVKFKEMKKSSSLFTRGYRPNCSNTRAGV